MRRDPGTGLTLALGVPAIAAALAVGQFDAALLAALASVIAGGIQAVMGRVYLRARRRRTAIRVARLLIALGLAGVVTSLAVPTSFALYVPVVGIAAAIGTSEAVIVGSLAVILYLLQLVGPVGMIAPADVARGIAGACVAVLVAVGARYYVARLEQAMAEARRAAVAERLQARRIQGIEEVGRQLAAGSTSDSFDRVMDLLVDRFGYRFVSIYLARPDGILELGSQRGYESPIETFDGSSGVVGRIMRTHEAELITDVTLEPAYVAADPAVRSEISAPLLVGTELLGILNVESMRRLDQTELRLVTTVADRLAQYVALGRERDRLADLSIRDPLTGVHNRRYLDSVLSQAFAARARREPEDRTVLTAVLFDLDHFGQVNKLHGLAAGDAALRRFGSLLGLRFRGADLVARYGGEEFLVVMEATLEDAVRRANEVREAFAVSTADGEPAVTVSAGCASLEPDRDLPVEMFLAAADAALSMAKRSGRDQVVAAAA
jgi:diguanylate cyclase (GGDEF)-like protein